MPMRGDCEEVFKNYKNFVCVLVAYVSFWVGFILWAFMGSFWATLNIQDRAFTYIGLHSVCDEWKGSDSGSDDYSVHGNAYSDVIIESTNDSSDWLISKAQPHVSTLDDLANDVQSISDKGDESHAFYELPWLPPGYNGYSGNDSESAPPPDYNEPAPWDHCISTLLYINPGGGK